MSEYEEDVSAMPSEPRIDELAVAMSGTGQQQDGVTMSFEDSTTVEKNDQMDRSKHEVYEEKYFSSSIFKKYLHSISL